VAGPLHDIRVVEVSTGIAGAYLAKLFADAGADVVKVEPEGGDPLRRWTLADVDLAGADSALFEHLNASKRSVVGDAADLIVGADLVVEDGRLDPIPDGPVVVSITPYGRSSPWADRPATEFTVQAECGSLGARGTIDRPPVQAGGLIAEWVSGAYGAAAGLAAVGHARRGGPAARIDVSMAEAMTISTTLFTDLMMSLMGRPPLPQPPRVVEFPSILPTNDGWVGFNTNAAQMFEDFLVLIGREDMLGKAMVRMDPTIRPGLEASAEAWTRRHTTAEVIEQASLFRIPVAPVGDGQNLLVHEHLAARGMYAPSPSGAFQRPRPGYRLNGARPAPNTPAPAVGEHTGRVESPVRPAPRGSTSALPWAGLKVLDLTSWWAGPAGTGLLAQLGADVIHVESIQRIDGMRPAAAGYFFSRDQWWEWSNFYLSINVDKRGITLNLNDPRGLDLAKRLIAWADVVAENFTPRVMEGFGLGWDEVRAINPRVVYARLPAYGLDGPWRDRVGFAQTMEAMSGLATLTGYPDGPPMLPRGPCDPNGAMHAAFAIQVALAARDETGEGQLVEAPLVESALNIAAQPVVEYTAYGQLLARTGNRTAGRVPQGVYRCRGDEERWVAVSVAADAQWAGLRAALGDPEWARDLDTLPQRAARADELDDRLAAWAAGRDAEDAVETLIAHGVPAGAVNDFRSISSHPVLQARGFFETVDHPVVGTHQVSVLPLRWSGIDRWIREPAPLVGQHNREVLGGVLGLSDEEISELEKAEVIGDRPVG